MYCKHCGREIDDNSSYCKYCGKPQDNRVQTPKGLIDFIFKKPILSSYILWVIVNINFLSRGQKTGENLDLLYPKLYLYQDDPDYNLNDYLSLNDYQITDFVVYAILIPLVIFLGYHYFKKVTSTKYRISWAIWFAFHLLMYNVSNLDIRNHFFPFTLINNGPEYDSYPLFAYDAYDLSELVFYTMIIPIAFWGYFYYKDRK